MYHCHKPLHTKKDIFPNFVKWVIEICIGHWEKKTVWTSCKHCWNVSLWQSIMTVHENLWEKSIFQDFELWRTGLRCHVGLKSYTGAKWPPIQETLYGSRVKRGISCARRGEIHHVRTYGFFMYDVIQKKTFVKKSAQPIWWQVNVCKSKSRPKFS